MIYYLKNSRNNMESEKKKICPKCKHEDGSGQNNIHDMNPEHFCKCPIRSIMERDGGLLFLRVLDQTIRRE